MERFKRNLAVKKKKISIQGKVRRLGGRAGRSGVFFNKKKRPKKS